MKIINFFDTDPEGIFHKSIEIVEEHTNNFGDMSLAAFARVIGDATMEYNEAMGLKYDKLQSYGLLWVLVRTVVTIHRIPKLGETIFLRGWAGAEKFSMYPRRFEIYLSNGEKVISACSQWLMIDKENRQLVSNSEVMKAVPIYTFHDEPQNPKLRVNFPKELTNHNSRVVKPEEIDLNGHMNNSYYIDWAMEFIDSGYMGSHLVSSLWIEYAKELFEGQTVILNYEHEEDSFYLRGFVEERESFSVRIDFTSSE